MPKYTTVAIAYDFDGTLAKGNLQENSFIPELGMTKEEFWKEVKRISEKHKMDQILAYMYLLILRAEQTGVTKTNKRSIKEHGKNVQYFDGVEDFFTKINDYAKRRKIKLQHYVISSGIKEMIEGTSIAKYFEYIYASSFMYNQNEVVEWPAIAVNYTTKTQYLFRINKGIMNAWDDSKINNYVPEEKRPIPFRNIIYIGDGETDIPAMKMVNYQGGYSIAVYHPRKRGAGRQARKFVEEKRAIYMAPADYTEGKDLYKIVTAIIDQISAKARIEKHSGIRKVKRGQKTK